MKKILFVFILFFQFSHLSAQNFLEIAAKEVCECINSKNVEELTKKQIENQLGACLLISIGKHKKEFEEYNQGKNIVEVDMEALGTEVGVNMAMMCPEFFMKILDSQEQESEMILNEIGQITSIENQLFNIVHFKSQDGSLLKFLWLVEFEGSEILIQNNFKNKKVSIQYDYYSLFDPKSKSYINYRVIYGLELL